MASATAAVAGAPVEVKGDPVVVQADPELLRELLLNLVLNACQAGRLNWKLTGLGGFAQAFLSRKAGAFIGTLWSVGDDTARDFTEALYTALLGGMAMAEAVKVARAAAKKADDPTWLAYVVYAHPAATLRLR